MRQFDQQIVESVALRRQRLRNAFFFGAHRWRRQALDHVKPLMMGVIAAAVIAAGCIATSFVMKLMDRQAQEQRQRNTPAVTTSVTPRTPAASTTPSRVWTTPPTGTSTPLPTTGTRK